MRIDVFDSQFAIKVRYFPRHLEGSQLGDLGNIDKIGNVSGWLPFSLHDEGKTLGVRHVLDHALGPDGSATRFGHQIEWPRFVWISQWGQRSQRALNLERPATVGPLALYGDRTVIMVGGSTNAVKGYSVSFPGLTILVDETTLFDLQLV